MGYAMCSHELQAPKLRGKPDHGQSAELLRWTTAAGDCRGMQEIRCGGKIVSGEGGPMGEKQRDVLPRDSSEPTCQCYSNAADPFLPKNK